MRDNPGRIVAEAILINRLFKARALRVNIPAGSDRQPSHYLTPTTVVYDLAVPMDLSGDKLAAQQDDLLSYVRQFRRMNGIVTTDESGMEVMPTVRIDRYEHTVEVSRPQRDTLTWSSVQWTPTPMTALCGLRYQHGSASPVLWNLSKPDQAHGLVAGSTGSGKTNQVLTVLYSLMLHNSPAELQITVVDPKNSADVAILRGLPHVRMVVSELNESVQALENFYNEMERRERRVVGKDVRHVLVVEECASLTEHPDKNVRPRVIFWLSDIARRCREANMNLIVATQKPTADVLGDQLKSNLLMRLVGSVTSKDDANTAVQVKASGAEALPGYGSFIYRLNRTMVRYQVPLIDTPAGLCRRIQTRWGGAELVQPVVHTPVRPGANGEIVDRTRVERQEPVAPVQVVQPFPLVDKRPLTTGEAGEVRRLAATMSKNSLCVHVYGAKSSRYMEWINAALADSQPAKKAPAFGRMLASLVREVKPL